MPQVVLFAGPNGSGKSTLKDGFVRSGRTLGTYINADEITTELYRAAMATGEYVKREQFEIPAFHEAERRRRASLDKREDFSFETVFSHTSKVDLIRDAKAAGYKVVLHFVATEDAALNVARVAVRVEKGGHPVPTEKVIARYARSLALLPDASMVADETAIYDNSGRTMRLAALMVRENNKLKFEFGEPLPKWVLRWAKRMLELIECVES